MRSAGIFCAAFFFIPGSAQLSAQASDSRAQEEKSRQQESRVGPGMLGDDPQLQAKAGVEPGNPQKEDPQAGKKAEPADNRSLRDRINFSGEARFRIMSMTVKTPRGFYGGGLPSKDLRLRDETSFPLRIRLNAHAEVVPNAVDFYARLTMNKRWGSYDAALSASSNPLDRPNSFESSIGHDMSPRFEQAYMTLRIPSMNATWYLGRLPGLDGAPSRQERSLFPRIFIDSEIDGTLIQWNPPMGALDKVALPWTKTRLRGKASQPGTAPAAKPAEAKAREKTGFILGYLKYDERKETRPDDADVYLAQAQLKIGQDTALIFDALYMDEWHMPNASRDSGVPDFVTPYQLAGVFGDTQILGFQLYGAFYYSHFDIPGHTWTDGASAFTYAGARFPGHLWYLGMNTGDLIAPNQHFCAEYAKGDDAWINPFNYRGFRRKGTVQSAANNYFYNRNDAETVVGFYPFNAGVLDIYYDLFYKSKVRFRFGLMDFRFRENELKAGPFPILGSNKHEHMWWPYFEVNIGF